jgi:hypothetical protein
MAELEDAGHMWAASEFLIGNTISDCVLAEISERSSKSGAAIPVIQSGSEVAAKLGQYVMAGQSAWANFLRRVLCIATVGVLLMAVNNSLKAKISSAALGCRRSRRVQCSCFIRMMRVQLSRIGGFPWQIVLML